MDWISLLKFSPSLVKYILSQTAQYKANYSVIWKNAARLEPVDIMPFRWRKGVFHEYFFPIKEFDLIKARIDSGRSVIVTGHPLAGKTRAVYQALKTFSGRYDVIIPKALPLKLPRDFAIPPRFTLGDKSIVILDDISDYASLPYFEQLIHDFTRAGALIVATCRTGPELEIVQRRMESNFKLLFDECIYIPQITREQAQEIAQNTGRVVPSSFDRTIGSIFLELDAMKERFRSCSNECRVVLKAVKRLYSAGVYREKKVFLVSNIKRICREHEQIDLKKYEWDSLFDNLAGNGFLSALNDKIRAEEVYLEEVVPDFFEEIDNLGLLLDIFLGDPEPSFDIGNRAYDLGQISLQRAKYMKIAASAYNNALKVWTVSNHPSEYGMTQNNLGAAYGRPGEVEEKAENCKKAIAAYQEALKVYTLANFPMDYGMTQYNLGIAFGTLAQAEDKESNYELAFAALIEALNTYKRLQLSGYVQMVQNGLVWLESICRKA
jgi:tetratricopeptide (TPR) repeat protein